MTELPRNFTVAEVAEALTVPEHYVKTKCRRREWPHRKGSRGTPLFTAEDVAAIRELMAVPAESQPEPRIQFAPRSRRPSRGAA